MKRGIGPVVAVALVLAWAPDALAQTADEIVEKQLAAVGGRAALGKLTSSVATGTVTISTQGGDIRGTIDIWKKAPNKSRTLMKLDLSALGGSEMIVDQRCDGKTAVASNSLQGDREITGSQLQNMLNASFPSPLLTYKDAGGKAELQGKDTVGGRPVLVLLYTPQTGPASKLLLDAETYLVVRTITKLDVPEAGGAIEQTTDLADYRVVDGVKSAFSVTVTGTAQTVVITLNKMTFNAPLDDAMFSRAGAK
jgi:outer membrane lipoprotein-sorting protein